MLGPLVRTRQCSQLTILATSACAYPRDSADALVPLEQGRMDTGSSRLGQTRSPIARRTAPGTPAARGAVLSQTRRSSVAISSDEQLGEDESMSHAQLGRIERGLQPYSQGVLEAIADALETDLASLLVRDPSRDEEIWLAWEQANSEQRKLIANIANTIMRGT